MFTYLKSIVTNTFEKAEKGKVNVKFNPEILYITVLACVSLSLSYYIGRRPGTTLFLDVLKTFGFNDTYLYFRFLFQESSFYEFNKLVYWIINILLFYFLLPFIYIASKKNLRLSDFGWSFKAAFKDYKIYLGFIIFMLPLVFLFSFSKSFQNKYPFYGLQDGVMYWNYFLLWQSLYFLHFIAIEFFFRGFILHGAKKALGFYAVFFMTIPYCMIHFGKPLPETIGAIFAGLVLGTMSLKSNSIWPGVLVHYSIAITMDLLSLWQQGVI